MSSQTSDYNATHKVDTWICLNKQPLVYLAKEPRFTAFQTSSFFEENYFIFTCAAVELLDFR